MRPGSYRQTGVDGWWADARFGLRALRRRPGYLLVTVATIALAIAASTSIFSVVYGVLMRPLDLPQPSELVVLWEQQADGTESRPLSAPDLEAIAASADLLEFVAGRWVSTMPLLGGPTPEELTVAAVTEEYFGVLGVSPLLGALPDPGDPSQALLSQGLWERRFGRDPGVVGMRITLGTDVFVVSGVLAASPNPNVSNLNGVVDAVDVWRAMPRAWRTGGWDISFLRVVGRLRDGATRAQLNDQLQSLMRRVNIVAGRTDAVEIRAFSMLDEVVTKVRPILLLLLAGVLLLLLTACVNVAQLTLAKATRCAREWRIRATLGATRGRLARAALIESAMIVGMGGAAGLALSAMGVWALRGVQVASLPRVENVELSVPVLVFALLLIFVSVLVIGLLPAHQASAGPMAHGLGERTGGGSRRLRHRDRALVVGELALAMVLLVGTGLLVRTFVAISSVDPGFRAPGVTTLAITPLRGRNDTTEARVVLAEIEARIRTLPGVQAAGLANRMPLTGGIYDGEWATRASFDDGESRLADIRFVTPGYFSALGIDLERGRVLDYFDGSHSVVIDEHMARAAFGEVDPLGEELWTGPFGISGWATVVGVVEHVRHSSLVEDALPTIYFRGSARIGGTTWLAAIKTDTGRDQDIVETLRQVLASIDPGATVSRVRRMEDRVADAMAVPWLGTVLLGGFAASSLLLAALGVYGLLSLQIDARHRDLALRQALGASTERILRGVLGEGTLLGVIGIVVGSAMSIAFGRTVESLLYQVRLASPGVVTAAALMMFTITLLASLGPALRAVRIHPSVALKGDE